MEIDKKHYGCKRNLFPNSERNIKIMTIVRAKRLVDTTATVRNA